MKFGVAILHHGERASKKSIEETAEAAERLEYDSAWVADHIISPVHVGKGYGYIYESLITLAYLASKTENLKLGTSILVLPLRDVTLLAKQVATLDALSSGRLILGVGAGWLKEEFLFMNKDFENRGRIMDEQIIILRKLLKGERIKMKLGSEEIEFYFEPKPVQKDLKILIGGNSKKAILRAAKLGDGWNPVGLSPRLLEKKIDLLRRISSSKKAIFLRIGIIPEQTSQFKIVKADESYYLSGSSREISEDIEKYDQAGVDHIICYFGSVDKEKYIERMKRFKEIMKSFQD